MNTKLVIAVCAVAALLAVPAWADWFLGDDYKMHYPQLPDPQGWDVAFDAPVETDPEGGVTVWRGPLGDDWQCSETGYVNDIHLWVSFREDQIPDPAQGEFVAGFLEIHSNVPAGVDADYSHPGEPLWGMGFDTNLENVKMRQYGLGNEGWYEPYFGVVARPDHESYFQINVDVPETADPFVQHEGEVYWLVSHMMILHPAGQGFERVPGKQIGWKTSISPHFMDDAVYGSPYAAQPTWVPIKDPYTLDSLDLAFVITGRPVPEPASVALLMLGVVGVLAISRRGSK